MDPTTGLPVPSDIPLPLPIDRVALEGLLVLLFLAHILFVNLMVGGSLLTMACEILGLRKRDYDTLAREIAKTITVNKSLAVVIGVAPLLAVNVLYTAHFYSANALTGNAWIMIVPLVSAAFLIAYAHKYSWDQLASSKGLHLTLGATATVLFLLIPLIFLANINLMLFPERWTDVRGFLSTVVLPNVLPRYGHFLCASIAVTALALLLYFTRAGYPVEEKFETLDRAGLRRGFYKVAFGATLVQFFVGPLLLFTLPSRGLSWFMIGVISFGVLLAVTAMILLWWEIVAAGPRVGRFYVPITGLIMCTAFSMGYGRHLYREGAIGQHRSLMARRTADFEVAAAAARLRAAAGITRGGDELPPGEAMFRSLCAGCHAVDKTLVGPSLTEIAEIYAGDPAGLIKWVRAPGRKRQGMPPMPAFRLSESKLQPLAAYVLTAGSGTTAEATTQPAG